MEFPEPTIPVDDERQVLLGYLDYFRSVLVEKAPGPDLPLPSGWTVPQLVNHLRHVERRWLEWGFEGIDLDDPWADSSGDRWHTDDDLPTLVANLVAQAAVTRRVVESHGLDALGRPSDRWDGADPPPLRRVLLHLVPEYARHVGHLDVVRELAGA